MVNAGMVRLGEIAAIWRYPVKSLSAEALEEAHVLPDGLEGDRMQALLVESGHARAGKPYRGKENNLLHTTREAAKAAAFASHRGVTVAVTGGKDQRFFDDAPVSLIFDRWIQEVSDALEMPLNPLRWRPNLYALAAGDFSMREPDLPGRVIEVGTTVLRVRAPIGRCVTTTYDVESGEPDNDVLLYVAQKRGNAMGVYCDVEVAGTVRAGDDLRLRDR